MKRCFDGLLYDTDASEIVCDCGQRYEPGCDCPPCYRSIVVYRTMGGRFFSVQKLTWIKGFFKKHKEQTEDIIRKHTLEDAAEWILAYAGQKQHDAFIKKYASPA